MGWLKWVEIGASILSGIAVCAPLVIKLIEVVKQLVAEKKWAELASGALGLMCDAEMEYKNGAEKKEYVMGGVEYIADAIGYNYDNDARAKMSALIDSICDAARILNKK